MRPYLVIDFGTTSTKSALVDLDTGAFHDLQRHPSIPASPAPAGHHEVPLAAIRARFDEICAHYLQPQHPLPPGRRRKEHHPSGERQLASGTGCPQRSSPRRQDVATRRPDGGTADSAGGERSSPRRQDVAVAGIVLCSEMHGFAVLDPVTRAPLTDYVSWLDARALEEVDGADTFSLVSDRLGPRFKQVTGMRPRPGFPLLNFTHLARQTHLPDGALVVSLPAYLALAHESPDTPVVEHPTILAGMALYDVETNQLSTELLALIGELTGCTPTAGTPCPEGTVAGHWRAGDRAIPVYAGVGDHQCSVLGAGLTSGDSASLNLGTGSQVTVLDCPAPDEAETRPYFDGRHLQTMTHIPAGRALAEYVGFLQRVAETAAPDADHTTTAPDFWAHLAELDETDVDAATLDIDLAIFEGARNFSGGGAIGGVTEGGLTPRNYLASLLRAFVDQYGQVLKLFDPQHRLERLVLSGGIARNLPNLTRLLTRRTGYKTAPAADLDESLLGLRTLALVADGRAPTCAEAQTLFGRDCALAD